MMENFILQFQEFLKIGALCLKDNIENFKDDLIFTHEVTGKNTIQYNDNQEEFEITDFQGNTEKINCKYGIAVLPASYILGRSDEYMEFLDNSSIRAMYLE